MHVLVIARSRRCRDNHLWRQVQEAGVTVSLVSSRKDECHCFRHDQHDLDQVAYAPAWSLGTDTSRWMRSLNSYVAALNSDLIHVDSEPWSLQVRSAILTGLPVVPHAAENVISGAPWWLKLRRAGLPRQLHRIAGLACWGLTSRDALESVFDLSSIPHAVVPACPPSPDDFPWRGRPVPTDVLRIGYVGRTVPHKGLPFLVSAIRRASLGSGKSVLQVMSSQPIPGTLLDVCHRIGVSVVACRSTGASDVADFMGKCDVIAVPSGSSITWSEQWGRVAAEAQMMGTPVFLSDSGELPNLATSLATVLPHNDVEAWAHELRDFAAKFQTEVDSSISGDRGSAIPQQESVAAKFSLADYADVVIDLWERSLEDSKS